MKWKGNRKTRSSKSDGVAGFRGTQGSADRWVGVGGGGREAGGRVGGSCRGATGSRKGRRAKEPCKAGTLRLGPWRPQEDEKGVLQPRKETALPRARKQPERRALMFRKRGDEHSPGEEARSKLCERWIEQRGADCIIVSITGSLSGRSLRVPAHCKCEAWASLISRRRVWAT